jgi:hypothetical protein
VSGDHGIRLNDNGRHAPAVGFGIAYVTRINDSNFGGFVVKSAAVRWQRSSVLGSYPGGQPDDTGARAGALQVSSRSLERPMFSGEESFS